MRAFLDCIPSTTTSQGGGKRMVVVKGKPMFFKNEKAASWTSVLTGLLAPYRPEKPLEGPLELDLIIVWPLTKGDTATKAKAEEIKQKSVKWHDQKPDWDNAPKALIDVMASLGFFEDDKQIVCANVSKLRGERPGIWYEIKPASELQRAALALGLYMMPNPWKDPDSEAA